MLVPTLLLPELAGALGRRGGAIASSLAFALQVSLLPRMHLIALDRELARTAAQLAGEQRLRGSDAVYGAVALAHAATLITLDQEQAMRLEPVLTAIGPGNWP